MPSITPATMHDYTFIHAGEKPPLTKNQFICPETLTYNRLFSIPDNGFFLSRTMKGCDTSYWLNYCDTMTANGDDSFDYWKSYKPVKYSITASYDTKSILVVTIDNIEEIFNTYGVVRNTSSKKYLDKEMAELRAYQEEIMILDKYMKTFKYSFDTSSIENCMANTDEFNKIVKTMKKYPAKVKPVLSLKKKTFNEWCMLLNRIVFLYGKIATMKRDCDSLGDGDYMERGVYVELSYDKIREAGYDGIYFPQSLITQRYKFTHDLIYIREFLKILAADTLIVWQWVF